MTRHFLPALLALLAILVGCAHGDRQRAAPEPAPTPAPAASTIRESVGDLEFTYGHGPGVSLRAHGVTVLNGSILCIVTPGWVGRHYVSADNMHLMKHVSVADHEGGRRVTIHHQLSEGHDSGFVATETHTLLPGNVYTVSLEYRLDKDEPALLEWAVGGFSPYLVAGLPWETRTAGATRGGVAPFTAPSPDVAESTIARAFDSLTIRSLLGDITIESAAAQDMILFDYRRNAYGQEDRPIFWFGYLERPFEPLTDHRLDYTIRFPTAATRRSTAAPAQVAPATAVPTDGARVPARRRDYIIPAPRHHVYTEARLDLSAGATLFVGSDPTPESLVAAEFLRDDLKGLYEVPTRILHESAPEPPPTGAIILGELPRHAAPARALAARGLALPDHPEGYALAVDAGAAHLAANTPQGLFYAATTLVQLVGIDDGGVHLRGAAVTDHPALDFRGVHALSGRGAGAQISRAVRDLLARHKMNRFVWECQYIVWDTAPELAHPEYAMSKEDARQVVDTTRRYFVELIPLIQSLGHSEWMFTNGQNLDLAEDPETPYAYNPTNPATYEFIFRVYQEALDFFQPRTFHIGHDEVTLRGRFPWRSRDSGLSITELMIMDINRLNEWFRERDVRVALWGDMFLNAVDAPDATFAPTPEIAAERRALLARDIIVTDWHYIPVPAERYTSIPLWKNAGFPVIGAGWFNPTNIQQLALACIDAGALGYLQTTWAGFNFRIDGNEEAWFQYWAYILAAHYAWSGDRTLPDELPWAARTEFLDLWFRTPPLLRRAPGFHVDLTPFLNRPLADPDGSGWLGYGPQHDFATLPAGDVLLGETTFRLARDNDGHGAVLLSGLINPAGAHPGSIAIGLDDVTARQWRFLLTCSFPVPHGERIGTLGIDYADGTRAELPLEYGRNVFAYGENRGGRDARVAWRGTSAGGGAIALWDLAWDNPHPGRAVRRLTVDSANTVSAPILFAVTGVQ